jgi:hypothetical protein
VDLNIFQGIEPVGDQQVVLGFGEAGEVVTGIAKLCQVFAKLFLTIPGTMQYHPELGTEFVSAMRIGRIQDEADVRSEFSLAAEAVRLTLNLDAETSNPPDDERLESAVLVRVNIDKAASKITLFVRVTSVAGESRVVFLPVPVAIR